MLLMVDNYDSFTYNLVQYLGELGADPVVRRNDAVTVDDVMALQPDAVVVSPGPGVPGQAGISIPLVRAAADVLPVLGVCLGHQAIAEAFGGRVMAAARLMHGKTSPIVHRGGGLFAGLPTPLVAMRYHSLLADPSVIPVELEVTAWTEDRAPGEEIMGLAHRTKRVWGVQFHPESVGTVEGRALIGNFLRLAMG